MDITVKVGVANETEKNLKIEDLKTWTPKNVNYFGDTVYFKHDKVYYSMKRNDFDKIYNGK